MPNRLDDVLPRSLTPFDPRTDAQAHANIRTVRDLERPHVTGERAKDTAWYAAHFKTGRIVRMNADIHTRLFRDRHHLPNEVRVILPQLFLAVSPAMR